LPQGATEKQRDPKVTKRAHLCYYRRRRRRRDRRRDRRRGRRY
jgi:hypothetical protein